MLQVTRDINKNIMLRRGLTSDSRLSSVGQNGLSTASMFPIVEILETKIIQK